MGDNAPIYYMDVKIKYKKNKSYLETTNWIVTKYESPIDIMRYDEKTMHRLRDELYGKTKQEELMHFSGHKSVEVSHFSGHKNVFHKRVDKYNIACYNNSYN